MLLANNEYWWYNGEWGCDYYYVHATGQVRCDFAFWQPNFVKVWLHRNAYLPVCAMYSFLTCVIIMSKCGRSGWSESWLDGCMEMDVFCMQNCTLSEKWDDLFTMNQSYTSLREMERVELFMKLNLVWRCFFSGFDFDRWGQVWLR